MKSISKPHSVVSLQDWYHIFEREEKGYFGFICNNVDNNNKDGFYDITFFFTKNKYTIIIFLVAYDVLFFFIKKSPHFKNCILYDNKFI